MARASKKSRIIFGLVSLVIALVVSYVLPKLGIDNEYGVHNVTIANIDEILEAVGEFSGEPYVVINDNMPFLPKMKLSMFPMKNTAKWIILKGAPMRKPVLARTLCPLKSVVQ